MAAAVIAAAIGGCGFGAGSDVGNVTLEVTDNFGVHEVGKTVVESAPGAETAMRQLERSHRIKTRYGGRYVQSIDGLAGGIADGRPVDWFYFVNGSEATVGAADLILKPGDRVWWDRRDWGAATHVSAVVGQWPEPFASSAEGGNRVEFQCVSPTGAEPVVGCSTARAALHRTGAKIEAGAARGTGDRARSRMLVGGWRQLRHDSAVRQLELGPSASGVYAIPAADGSSIALLGTDASVVRRLDAGAGLVAAIADSTGIVTWVVTGVGEQGIDAAAAALTEQDLSRKFAAVINPDGTVGSLPEVSR